METRSEIKKLWEKINGDPEGQIFGVSNAIVIKLRQQIEDHLKKTILENTKIKEPITKGKLKWHGIKLCFIEGISGIMWLEQRGKQIGEKYIRTF